MAASCGIFEAGAGKYVASSLAATSAAGWKTNY
jgi:hypothetical protein